MSYYHGMRKKILQPQASRQSSTTAVALPPGLRPLDVASSATVLVTSESAEHPLEHAFDGVGGQGATRWVADSPGEQTLIVELDAPQLLRRVIVEVEEPTTSRHQELDLSVSTDGGQTYRELRRQQFHFSPGSYEREDWDVTCPGVTHVKLHIVPETSGGESRASLTSLTLGVPA
jgi:hypothetical protein